MAKKIPTKRTIRGTVTKVEPREKTYDTEYRCDNCGKTHTASVPFGVRRKESVECPHCGCPTTNDRNRRGHVCIW